MTIWAASNILERKRKKKSLKKNLLERTFTVMCSGQIEKQVCVGDTCILFVRKNDGIWLYTRTGILQDTVKKIYSRDVDYPEHTAFIHLFIHPWDLPGQDCSGF